MFTSSINLEYLYKRVYLLLTGESLGGAVSWLALAGEIMWWLLVLAIPLFLFLIVRLNRGINSLLTEFKERRLSAEAATRAAAATAPVNARWQGVLEKLNSANAADWQVAVLEADKMLEDLVAQLYPHLGSNLGERLKNVEPSDFPNLQNAWDAHKVRNQLAHESGRQLTARETRVAIENYRAVFESFKYI